jgi:hypothetical protein
MAMLNALKTPVGLIGWSVSMQWLMMLQSLARCNHPPSLNAVKRVDSVL